MGNLRWMLAASAACAVLISASTAAAEPEAASTSKDATLEEIIVTAQKHGQSVQELPGVVSAITGDRIKALGVSNIENLTSEVSGLTFYSQAGANFVTLRGVGVPVDNGAADNNISINVDGVVLPRQTEAGLDSTDLQRVEVLRGPQGTLYGRNATGGAINFISAPPTETFTGRVSVNGGNYDTWGTNGFVSGPITDQLRFRLSASHEARNKGYVHNVFTGGSEDKLDRTGVRAALSADLTPNLTADFSVSWQRELFDSYQALLAPGLVVPNAGPQLAGNLATVGLVQGHDYSLKPFEIGSNYPGNSERKTLLSIARLKWDLTDRMGLTSITGYVDHTFEAGTDGDGTSYPANHIAFGGPYGRSQPSKSFSQEFNLSGGFGHRGTWLVGAYYFHEDLDFTLPVTFDSAISPFFNQGTVVRTGTIQTTKSYAVFADGTLPITDNFRIFAGARVSKEEFTAKATSETINPNGVFQPFLVPLLPLLFGIPAQNPTNISCLLSSSQAANTQPTYPNRPTSSQDHTPFTPRIGAQYDVMSNVMLYAQYSKGFKAGGLALSNDCTNQYAPESLIAYEVGIKSQMLNGRLTLNVSEFHYDYSNMQIFKILANGSTEVENADTKIDGVDFTVEALLGRFFRIDFAATYLNDRFTKFCSADPSWPSLSSTCPSGVGTGQNLDGRPLPNVPNYTINAGLEGVFPVTIGPFDRLTLRGEPRFVGRTELSSYGDRPQTRQDAYELFNATATLASTADGLLIRAFIRNIADTAVLSHVVWVGTFNGQWQPPRTFGMEVSKQF